MGGVTAGGLEVMGGGTGGGVGGDGWWASWGVGGDGWRDSVEEMVAWMDSVDEALASINKDSPVAETYEDHKKNLMSLVGDMDSRRDSMKWLVQKLDSLSNLVPKEDGRYEQLKLESLVARYKALVPNIETATARADIFSKCYLYREDINTVIETLNEVKRHCDRTLVPDNLEIVHQLIKEQDILVKQLEEQRDNIFETLQRGKDLSKDPSAPLFVSGLVQTLEARWNEAYNGSVEKLNKLKNTRKVWSDYSDQKSDIQKLLSQAEAELSQVVHKNNPQEVANELSHKQEMNEHLNEATDQMLRKLNSLSVSLAELSRPEKRPLLKNEVQEIERRLQTVIETVTEKIEYLEQLNSKWVNFTTSLTELKKWVSGAHELLERLVTLDMNPEDRAEQTKKLKNNLIEKMAVIRTLEDEGLELLEGEPCDESLQFSSDFDKLKGSMSTLTQHTTKHEHTVQKELVSWKKFQVQVQEIRPWIEEAEIHVSTGLTKPSNLQEAIQQSKTTKEFEQKCDAFLGKIRTVSSESAQMPRFGSIRDEVDALHSRWAAIHDVVVQWSERTESLVAEWEDFNYKCDAVTSFIHQVEERLEAVSEFSPKILQLDDRIDNLKEMSQELGDKQSSMINLTATSDHIAAALNTEGATAVKASIMELKSTLSRLTDEVMKLKNELSDVVILKEEYTCKLNSLETWLNRFGVKLDEIEDIDIDELDNLPDMLHSMQQEHDDRQVQVTNLAEECRDVGEKCTGRDRDEFYQMFDDNESRYEHYGTIIQSKKPAIMKWKEFWDWQLNSYDTLSSIKQQLDTKLSMDEYSQISKELMSLNEQCRGWEDEAENIKELCRKSSTTEAKEDLAKLEAPPNDAPTVQTMVNIAKKAVDALKKTRQQLENYMSKSQHLRQQLENMDSSNPSAVKEIAREIQTDWQKTLDNLMQRSQTLEGLHVLWKQISQSRDEIFMWLNETCSSLDDRKLLEDPDKAMELLEKYKSDLPGHESSFKNLKSRISQLESLNGGKSIPVANSIISTLTTEFDQTHCAYSKLSSYLEEMKDQESSIFDEIKDTSETLIQLRDRLLKCEDVTGADQQILDRFEEAKQIEIDTNEIAGSIIDIMNQIEDLQSNFAGCDIKRLKKDYTNLSKKQQTLVNQCNKVCTTLERVIEKHYQDKLDDLMRFIAVHQEKIEWCQPEPGIDRYGIEAKLATLKEAKLTLKTGDTKKNLLQESKPLADQVIPPDMREKFDAGFNSTITELDELQVKVQKTEVLLDKSLKLWQEYEQLTESLSVWLKEAEGVARAESSNLIDLDDIEDKIEEIDELVNNIEEREEEMSRISQHVLELQKLNPESKAKEYSNALYSRLEKIKNFCATYSSQLEQLQKDNDLYKSSLEEMKTWLEKSEEKLQSFENMSISGGKPSVAYQAKLQNLKEFVSEKKDGQKLLNSVVERGESLFSSISSSGRESIRLDLRTLRDTWESHLERVNQLYKHVETIIMQWSSFDDNLNQAMRWMDEIQVKVDAPFTYKKTLADKKSQCQQYKLLQQDINSHETMVYGLQEKMEFLSDEDVSKAVDALIERYQEALSTCEELIESSEKYVNNHDKFLHDMEVFRDWLNSQTNELTTCAEVSPDHQDVENKMAVLENLESVLPDGQALLDACEASLEKTLNNTAPNGHDVIKEELEVHKKTWQAHQTEINDRRKTIGEIMSQFYDCEEAVEELREWLKAVETRVKDQSLKSTLEDKEEYIDSLRQLEDEISYKGRDFNNALSQAQSLDSDGKHANSISQMMTRYQALKNTVKEMLNRYQHFVREHRMFLEKYQESMEWLDAVDQDLHEHAAVVGDMQLLQMRRNKVEQLVELKSTQANKLESVLELGERLYVHTAPDGREALRQMLRQLRDQWETWCEAVTSAAITLDQCLHQFSDFSNAQEQLTRWLKGVEVAMQQHTELKGSLQEKKSQLQNHRLVHQEIETHQNLVETVCEKAQTLVDQTQDRGLNVYIQSIKTLFKNILIKSKDLLDKLDLCVKDHASFNSLCKSFTDWLNSQKEQLQLCADASGEKSDLLKKVETLKDLGPPFDAGHKRLTELRHLSEKVASSTSVRGGEVLRATVTSLEDSWNHHCDTVHEVKSNLEDAITKWTEFTAALERHSMWCREMELCFKDQTPCSTLQEKQHKVDVISEKRDEIVKYEKEIDAFVDLGHVLVRISNMERLKPLVTQLSSRYQNLHVLSKEASGKWCTISADHKAFESKLAEQTSWMTGVEERLTRVSGERDYEERQILLSQLTTERDQAAHRLSSLTSHGERLYPYTATQGRDKLRQDIKKLRDRWEVIELSILEEQRKQDVQMQQSSALQDSIASAKSWLESIEKVQLSEPSNWLSVQEIRSRLLKQKSTLQEIVAHKRVLDSIRQKVELLPDKSPNKIPLWESVESLETRHQELGKTTRGCTEKLEWLAENLTMHQELCTGQVEWQKEMWEKLHALTDYSGNKSVLEERMEGVNELERSKGDGRNLIAQISAHSHQLLEHLPSRAKETIERDINNMKYELAKYASSLADAKHGLEDRVHLWRDYETTYERILNWLEESEGSLRNFCPRDTLQEKTEQLEKFQNLIYSVNQHQGDIEQLTGDSCDLMGSVVDARISVNMQQVTSRFKTMQQTAKELLKKCETGVKDTKNYMEKYNQCVSWLTSAQDKLSRCLELAPDRTGLDKRLENSSELLKEKQTALALLNSTVELGEKLYASTGEDGSEVIRGQLEDIQQAYDTLFDSAATLERDLNNKISRWSSYEEAADELKNRHALVMEFCSIADKLEQNLIYSVNQHQGDIEQLTGDSCDLMGSVVDARISVNMQQVTSRFKTMQQTAKELLKKCETGVKDTKNYMEKYNQCVSWLTSAQDKLSRCLELAPDRTGLDKRLENSSELLKEKQTALALLNSTVELGEKLYASTGEDGSEVIRGQLEDIQQAYDTLFDSAATLERDLNNKISRWSSYEEAADELKKWVKATQKQIPDYIDLKTTLDEKRAQLQTYRILLHDINAKQQALIELRDKSENLPEKSDLCVAVNTLTFIASLPCNLQGLEEKLRCEKYEVEGLKVKANEMLTSEKQGQVAVQAQNVLKQFESLSDRIRSLRSERETQYRDHRHYKEAHDDLLSFINRTRDKIPALRQRNLSDKLSIETSAHAMETLLSRQAQGQILVDQLFHRGEVLLHSTSSSGQDNYKKEMESLKESFEELFQDIAEQKDALQHTVLKWREYKDEYERLSDWLQKTDADMKAYKTMLYTSIGEKTEQVQKVKEVLRNLEQNQSQLERLGELSETLQKTHLDTFVKNQMSHINSRYQLLLTMAKDVVKKVEATFDQHKQFEAAVDTANEWMDNVQTVLQDCSSIPVDASKETLERHLEMVQSLIRKQEDGQALVNQAVNWGEKVLRNTRADGRDEINERIDELQSDWDKLVKRMSSTKVNLETSLLEWTDMNASYSNMQQWISEREAKLQQLSSQMVSVAKRGSGLSQRVSSLSIGERKANLRRTTCIVQDIVSFEPVIESVTSKATESQAGQVKSGASEISSKYQNLTKQAKELLELQQEMVTQHQDFVDAGNEFMHWLRSAKERMTKCAEPTGDKDTISGKATVLKMLQNEQEEGQEKLDKAFHLAEKACSLADDEDKEVIEEEVAFLQDEFDKFLTQVGKTKNLLEMGIVKWTEYEDKFKECEVWVANMETKVHNYNKLQNTAEEKRAVLEEFQAHLQSIFDWQKTLDLLNIRAQLLLETCADSRVSNAVTQLTTKYNTLLSLAKEVMRRLEIHFQEHQQHNQLYAECNEWIETTKFKLEECDTGTTSTSELQENLATVKSIKNSLEQGQHKLRYVLELKERVILNTEQEGAAKIQQNTENIRLQFEQLISDIYGQQQEITALLSKSAETEKMCQDVMEWMEEIEVKALEQGVLFSDLSEKRGALEKYRIIIRDIAVHHDMIDRLAAKKIDDDASREMVDTCITKYEALKSQVAKNIKILEGYVKHHEGYYQAYMDATEWLRKISLECQQSCDCHGDKSQALEKQARQLELEEKLAGGESVINKAVTLNKNLMETTSEEGRDALGAEAENLKQEWLALQNSNVENLRNFSKCLQAWHEYQETYDKFNEWVQDFQSKIESEPKDPTPEDLEEWKGQLEEGMQHKGELEALCERCEILMSFSCHRPVRDMTLALQARYSSAMAQLQSLVMVAQKTLTDHTEFVTARDEVEAWLNRSHGTVAECQDDAGSEQEVREKLETLKAVSTRATEGLHLLGVLGDAYSRAVSMVPAQQQDNLRAEYTRLRDSYDRFNISISSAITKLKSLVMVAQKTLTDHTEFVTAREEVEAWLNRSHGTVAECQDDTGSEQEVREKLETLKTVSTRATEGLHLLGVLGDAYSRAVSMVPAQQQDNLRAEYTRLRDSYDRFNISISSAITKLKHSVSRWAEFSECKSRLQAWLSELEDLLSDTPESRGEVSEMRTLLERYRHTQQQIQDKERELKRQLKDAKEFSERSGDASYQEDMAELEQKWESLNDRCSDVIDGLENEIKEAAEYQSALQEIEKWLLQVSFQLMAENSKFIRSREQTEEQIKKHDKEILNIREYQQTLDRVKNKGHKQINKYIGSLPSIQETIERQLHNIQESYDSLLRTAVQIEKRLAESLAKFEEYEATLEAITSNLDDWEPTIVEETNTAVQTMEEAKYQLEMTRSWQSKLLGEKSKLAFAVQACEAATAAISRPGSPRDLLSQSIPEREILVRAKLQDLTEQIQVRICSISSTVTELEDLSKQNEDIKKWIEDNQHLIQELRNKPVKLRHEAQASEVAQLNDLRSKIIEKQNILDDLEVKQMTLTPDSDDDDIRCQMNSLEEEVNDIIDHRSEVIASIEEYRAKLQGVYSWFDTIIKQLEKCDKPDHPDSKRRNEEVQKLWGKFREANVKVEELTEKASEIKPKLSSLDNQQVDEQLRSVQKKYSDLKKRVSKKKQVIEMTRKGYEDAKQNINDLSEWFIEKTEFFDGLPMLGHSSKNVELRIMDFTELQKEIVNKTAVIAQIEKTIDNIKGDVEMSEVQELEQQIQSIRSKQEEINARTDEVKTSLVAGYDERQNFEDNLEQISFWMKGKESEVACPSLLPLKADAAEKVYLRYKKLESDVKLFYESNLASAKRQAESLLKECDEEDAYELNETMQNISITFTELRETLSGTLNCILNLVEARRDFEKLVDVCTKWISEAEGALQVDTRSLNTTEILEEHLKKLEKLDDEQEEANARVNSIGNMCTDLLEYLTDADKFSLGEIVRKLQDRSELINLSGKIEQVREAIFTQKQMTERMVQSTQTLSNIQKEARALSRPVGRTVQDGQNLLLAYQAVMRKVSEFRRSLEEMKKCPDITMEEMRELIRQQQDLMSILEKQITRIRQLILVRQQYSSLVSEISTFISRYTIIVGDIEKSELVVSDKLKKLRAVIIKIQECEGQLTSAQDKGSIIGEEGHVEDRNAIMEELQTLRSGLSNLRREVENKQQEHEITAESHKKLQVELNTAMEWLFEQESELKSRPLLTLEVESADDEINTHNTLSQDIKNQLEKVKSILAMAKKETGLPYILQERISEANMVLSTYPLELDSRLKYLNDAKMLRVDYEEFSTKISDWVTNAKSRLESGDATDFESLSSELDDHYVYFASEKFIGESLQQLGQTAERIVPSLGSDEQEELTMELQELTKDLDEVTKSAKQRRLSLEKDLKEFSEYKLALDKCRALIHSASSNLSMDDTAQSIASLRSALQRIDEERNRLYDQKSVITDFTEKANAIIAKSDETCQGTVGQELVDVSKRWKTALEKIETRREKVRLLIEQWQRYELSLRSLEAGLSALEQRVKEIESDASPTKNKEELDEILEDLEEEAEDLLEEVEGVKEASVKVLEYLRTVSAASHAAARRNTDGLAKRHAM
ncbi:Spectrin repeat [Trinorchestia longiramus]|nr:Spectrin repeat [Trinorchestia longiramus]